MKRSYFKSTCILFDCSTIPMHFQCSLSTNTKLIHFDYCYYGKWQKELRAMNQALPAQRGLDFPPPRWDAARPAHVCGAIKVMEGNNLAD